MMEVLITFPLHEDIDLTILEEFMLIIYQPKNISDDRFDKIDEYEDDYLNKPLLYTQKSATNHVILDGIHEISFHLKLPKASYIYLHKQKDKLLLNEKALVATLGNGRKVNYITPDNGRLTFEEVSPLPTSLPSSPKKTSSKATSFDEFFEKQIISDKTPIKRDTISRILNVIEDSVKNSGEDKTGECVTAMK